MFDAVAGSYDDWYRTPLGAFADQVEQELVERLAQPRPGETVLDLGCGTGTFSLPLARLGCKVTGIDPSAGMLARAREKAEAAGLAVTFIEGDAQRLPFADNSFDLVVTVTALEFMRRPRAALAEALRVLKPGGRLVAGFLGKGSQWEQVYRQEAEANPESIFARARFYSPEEAAALGPGLPPEAVLKGLYVGPLTEAPPEAWPEVEAAAPVAPGFYALLWRKPALAPALSLQVALHPLADDYGAVVSRALATVDLQDVTVEVGAMSTTITGPADAVWQAVRDLWEAAAAQGKPLAMVTVLSNTCGVPEK